ncbi:putative sugar lactone lactonase YvrE [Oscarella lobularis]|uniref:putative sugar lactone lactonase YvrE n=1 Tax=Oscarella lobularis TaxID=121494 RepID=UPI003314381D
MSSAKVSVSVVSKRAPSVLAEGPHWDDDTGRLLWVDIAGKELHILSPDGQTEFCHEFDKTVSSVVTCTKGDDLLLTVGTSITLYSVGTKSSKELASVTHDPGLRFNDGKCDPEGRMWAGTMADPSMLGTMPKGKQEGAGSLYCFEKGTTLTKETDITIANGLAWTNDKRHFFYVDSSPRKVYVYDYDVATGGISNRRVAIDFSKDLSLGYPDGICIDADDKLWIAGYESFKLTYWDPFAAKKLQEIPLPVAKVSSCCWGGPDYRDLYVTTSQHELTEEERKEQPLAGSVFCVKNLGMRGLPSVKFNNS